MAYTKQVWENAPSTVSPILAERLNYMEQGIFEAAQTGGGVTTVDGDSGAIDLSGVYSPLGHKHSAEDLTSGFVQIARITPGSAIVVDYAKNGNNWPSARPTARTDITVIWRGPTDPGSKAITGDKWEVTS